jgi:hypothetical protein
MMTLAEVPLYAPIPSTECRYAWDEVSGYWVTWIEYVFAAAHRNERPAAAAVTERRRDGSAARSPLLFD